jgi:hypothetical protein
MRPPPTRAIVREPVQRLSGRDERWSGRERTSSSIYEPADEDIAVAEWRTEQLERLGIPEDLARTFADEVDWRDIASLVERGCHPELALEIVR